MSKPIVGFLLGIGVIGGVIVLAVFDAPPALLALVVSIPVAIVLSRF